MSIVLKQDSQASIETPATGETALFVDVLDDHLKIKLSDGTVEILQSTLLAGITELTGDVVAVGPGVVNVTLSSAVIVSKILAAFSSVIGAVNNSDSILSAVNKLSGTSTLSRNEVDQNVTVPSNYTWIRQSATLFSGTTKLTIQAGARVTFI